MLLAQSGSGKSRLFSRPNRGGTGRDSPGDFGVWSAPTSSCTLNVPSRPASLSHGLTRGMLVPSKQPELVNAQFQVEVRVPAGGVQVGERRETNQNKSDLVGLKVGLALACRRSTGAAGGVARRRICNLVRGSFLAGSCEKGARNFPSSRTVPYCALLLKPTLSVPRTNGKRRHWTGAG